ncbi:MAG TPA: substrate-binding domain-containing protein [bacterium]|nr:substrate-binding domain-containing protein [bacterium]
MARLRILVLLAATAALATSGCGGTGAAGGSRTLTVYGFSILGEVMTKGIFPAFAESWQRERRERLEILGAFASSGTVTNQILFGAPAQVAILSLELDALKLRKARVARTDWHTFPHRGVVNRTPFIVITRPGNPKQIRGFHDLTRPRIAIAHPDPLTSGGALWALLAEYGSVTLTGGTPAEARAQLLGIWRNVRYQASSARAVRTQFEAGFGDALITYEQETLSKPIKGTVVIPPSTILSEHVAVLVDRNVRPQDRELVNAFLRFLWTPDAQRIFVKFGFRSVDERLNAENPDFGSIARPFTVADLGGWPAAYATIVEGVWKGQVLPEVRK